MPHCETCGTEYSDPGDPCPVCGPAGDPVRCARCGEEFSGSDACPACGRARQELSCEVHPDRVAEDRCVVCGRALCAACDAGDGRVALCGDHSNVPLIQGWAQVYTTTKIFDAQLLCENLHAEGVDAQIFSQKDAMLSVDLGDLSIVRLLVPVWQYQGALGVIRDHMDAEGEVGFACPVCGEAYEAGVRECATCSASLP